MKRLSLIFVALILISSSVFALEVGEKKFGIMGGLNMSNTRLEGGEWVYGGAGGLFMKYQINEMFQIQPEALFKMRGWKESEAGVGEMKNKINYIDIDLIARLTIPSESNVKGSIGVGAYGGFKISDSYEYEWEAAISDLEKELADDITEELYENLKSYDFGLILSGCVEFVMENGGAVILDVRYELGLVTIFDAYTSDLLQIPLEFEYKNQAIQVFAGYAF